MPGSISLSKLMKNCDPNFIDFIDKCIEWKADKRLVPEAAFAHPWIK